MVVVEVVVLIVEGGSAGGGVGVGDDGLRQVHVLSPTVLHPYDIEPYHVTLFRTIPLYPVTAS